MPTPARGDIYHIGIAEGEHYGHELYGGHWWVVLSSTALNHHLGLFTAVPLTSVINKEKGKPKDEGDFRLFRIRVLNKHKIKAPERTDSIFDADSIALSEQMRTFSVLRIKDQARAGTVDELAINAIEAGVLFVLGSGISRRIASESTERKTVVAPDAPKPIPGRPLDLYKK